MSNIIVLSAISNSTRFKLLQIIGKKEICACELPSGVGISQSGVSQHLQVLKSAGLVSVRKSAAMRLYSVSGKGKKVLKCVKSWEK